MGNHEFFPVRRLMKRYDKSRSTMYGHLGKLNVKTCRIGRYAHITSAQLQLLDDLHEWLQQPGATIKQFLVHKGLTPTPPLEPVKPNITASRDASTRDGTARSRAETEHLSHLRLLEEAVEKCWPLTAKELAPILHLSPPEILALENPFYDRCFEFTRWGTCANGAQTWRVSKRYPA